MSTIDEIVKIEAEAASMVAAAQKEAEQIRQEGLAAAAKIVEEATAAMKADDGAILVAADERIKADDARTMRENAQKIAARKAQFEKRTGAAVDWILNTLLASGA